MVLGCFASSAFCDGVDGVDRAGEKFAPVPSPNAPETRRLSDVSGEALSPALARIILESILEYNLREPGFVFRQ
jgi:hypothetical protein